ncbi:MAG: tetratricopeptide repeat protein [Microcoleaceae cyanobacterium MO_207.B10]|nr:tetratricopeptide repeat protein [Microcoleaceae cyanobacterium MO_207.B10]
MSDFVNQKNAALNLSKTAEIYLSQGKLDAAYATCLKALEILPNCGEIHKTLGNVMQKMGKLELAKNCYLKAIADNHNLAESYANLGSISARQKQWEQAIKYYEKALSIQPDFAGFYRNLAKIWQCLGKEQLVIECTYQALILEPTLATATEWLNLGDKSLELGKQEEAIACYNQAIKSDKKLSLAYNKLGNTLIQKGELDRAITVYRQGIKISPNNPTLHYNLGEALTQKQEYQQAKISYNRAIGLNPNNHLFYIKLGEVLQKQGLLEEAIACLIGALQVKADQRNTYLKIAELLEKQKYLSAAVRCKVHQQLSKDVLEKFCKLTGDWEVTSNAINTINLIKIHPPSQIDLLPSQNIEKKLHPNFQTKVVELAEELIAIIPEARVWADQLNSVVITSDNKVVRDISSGNGGLIISSSKLPPVHKLKGTVVFLSVKFGAGGYYHWMFDMVARISLLYQSSIDISSIDKFIVNKIQTRFHQETIKKLGIPQSKIIESCNYPHIQTDRLIVPSIPIKSGFRTTKIACEALKNIFLSQQISSSSLYPERIYINRSQTSKRRVVNEEEVVNLLEKFGFQSIILESLSIEEQALYLANALVVIAPHGAGLTNILFCNPGTKIVEIFAPEYILVCYWVISNICGLEHYHLIGDEFENNLSDKPAQKDIFVNLQKLLELMKLAQVI